MVGVLDLERKDAVQPKITNGSVLPTQMKTSTFECLKEGIGNLWKTVRIQVMTVEGECSSCVEILRGADGGGDGTTCQVEHE